MKEGADYRTANDIVRDIGTRYNHLIKLSSNKVWRARELAVRNYEIGLHEQWRNHEEEGDVMIHTQRGETARGMKSFSTPLILNSSYIYNHNMITNHNKRKC